MYFFGYSYTNARMNEILQPESRVIYLQLLMDGPKEDEWLLPMLEVLDMQYEWSAEPLILDVFNMLVYARLEQEQVARIRSVTLPTMDRRTERVKRLGRNKRRDNQLDVLQLFVPDYVIVSAPVEAL